MDSDYLAFPAEPQPSTSRKDRQERRQDEAKAKRAQKRAPVSTSAPGSLLTPWADLVRWDDCRDPAEQLNYEVMACVDYMSAQVEEHEVRRMVIEEIRRAVKRTVSTATVTPFGSFGTNMYLPGGDIDLVVVIPDMETDVKQILREIARSLRKQQVAKNMIVIDKAKVPIIKFSSVTGDFAVDISINQTNGVRAAQLINGFVDHYPALRYLVMIVKMFLARRGMNEVRTGGLGSYSTMHPKIRNGEIDPMENLGVLLVEFFELYGHYFNYHEVGISLHNGGMYYSKQKKGYPATLKLSIEDPQDQSNDISGGSYEMPAIRKIFAAAFESLTSALLLRAQDMESRRFGTHVKLQKASSRSILSSIIGVDEAILTKRVEIAQLYEDGNLHRRLGERRPKKPPSISLDPACMPGARAPPTRVTQEGAAGLEEAKAIADEIFIADTSPELDPVNLPRTSQKSSKKRKQKGAKSRTPSAEAEEEAEESRYSIPKAKRRRVQETLEGTGAQTAVLNPSV
ncbi:hypothetical protein M407DRAFT_210152 [Tulasnella calospora MUT 4182]|uniref:polynucleotide adenylyltransferase n=1 Tax=Tulasnella calospora MUT 4182 TaxID=1051891 RepID=A0A0C3LKU6_9AGAM|nr:hypothetical protein M407DRAFT_210152 [Tulasnella calospora MUT 4182]